MRVNLKFLVINKSYLNGEPEFNYFCDNSGSDPKQTSQVIISAFGILISYWWGYRDFRGGAYSEVGL